MSDQRPLPFAKPKLVGLALAVHWAAMYGFLAAAVNLGGSGAGRFGPLAGLVLPGTPSAAFVVSVLLALSSVLFAWHAADLVLGGAPDDMDNGGIGRIAFSFAALSLTVLSLFALAAASSVAIGLSAALFAGLAASFAAANAEVSAVIPAGPRRVIRAARQMAAGAAHNSLLTPLSGRQSHLVRKGR